MIKNTFFQKKGFQITVAILLCLVAGAIGSAATQTSVNTWYTTIVKPSFNPPNWVFAPVWTTLFVLMGVAAGIVWSHGFYHKWVKTALYHFAFQLILNVGWSLVFFGLKEIFGGLLVVSSLFVLLLFTFKWFKVVNKTAAYLLLPYILWVSFALVLNFSIWKLN